jgi:hypothetical protein
MSKLHHSIWAGSLVFSIGITIICYFGFQKQLVDLTNLLNARNHELEETQKEFRALRQQLSAADVGRVHKERLELARLRDEVRRLRKDAASNSEIEKINPVESVSGESDRTPVNGAVQGFSTQTTVDVPTGDSLILGGWETSPGQRVLIMIEPKLQEGDGTELLVQIDSHFFELPEEKLESLGLDKTAGTEPDSAWLSNLSKEKLFTKLLGRTGIDILSGPRMTILNGQRDEFSGLQSVDIGGEDYSIGPSVQIMPEILENGRGVTLTVNAGIVLPTDTLP